MGAIIVLSYIATIHIVSNKVVATRDTRETIFGSEKAPQSLMSGPIYLKPVSNAKRSQGVKLHYRQPVKKAPTKNWRQIKAKKKSKHSKKMAKKKHHSRRHLASDN